LVERSDFARFISTDVDSELCIRLSPIGVNEII